MDYILILNGDKPVIDKDFFVGKKVICADGAFKYAKEKNTDNFLKLLEENKRLYVTEFADRLDITKSQMTALVDKLIEMGYVKRINDIEDRRKIYLSATNNGAIITSTINKSIDNQINNHLIRLTQEELKALENGLLILQKLCFNCNTKNH